MVRLFRHRQTKGTGTDKPNLKRQQPALYSTYSSPIAPMATEMSLRYKKLWSLIQKLSKVNWEILNLENK